MKIKINEFFLTKVISRSAWIEYQPVLLLHVIFFFIFQLIKINMNRRYNALLPMQILQNLPDLFDYDMIGYLDHSV